MAVTPNQIQVHQHHNGQEIRNYTDEKLTSAPSVLNGRKYYNTSNNTVYICVDGTYRPIAVINDATTDTLKTWSSSKIQQEIDNAIAGLDFQSDVLNVQTDNTLDPGATPTNGDRYILTDVGNLHANFGTITGVANNDIVEYVDTEFVVVYDVSVKGEGVLLWVQGLNVFYRYDGTNWAEFGGLSGITAGNGLSKTGNTLDVNVDNSTIEINSDSLRVKDAGITASKLASASVTPTKLANKYAVDVLIADFTSGEYTITAATHGLGASEDLTVVVKDANGQEVGCNKTVAANGDVTVGMEVVIDCRILVTA